MKKLLTSVCLVALSLTAANAQAVLGYTVAEEQGTYVPLSAPTVIFDGSKDAESLGYMFARNIITPQGIQSSRGEAEGFSLGFDMTVGDATYNSFFVSSGGYVCLGSGTFTYNPSMGQNFLSYGGSFNTAGFSINTGGAYKEDTKISYQTFSGDDAHLVVQYENYGLEYDYSGPVVYVDVQVILYKNGLMKVVFNNLDTLEKPEDIVALNVGLRQGENYVCAYGERGALVTSRNKDVTAGFKSDTPDGTTVVFNLPRPCVKPASQPADLVLNATSEQIDGSFTASSSADSYLVVYNFAGTAAGLPVNGTTYEAGGNLGDGIVVKFGAETSFSVFNLPGGAEYSFTVYAANSYGLEGPVYNTVAPLTASVSTLPAPAAAVEFIETTLNSVSFKVTPNEANDDIVVVYNDYCDRDIYGDHGLFGSLAPDAKAGDILPVPEGFTPYWAIDGAPVPENAGIVAYAGKADGNLSIENLKPGTGYYIGVYTRNAEGKYTSNPLFSGFATHIDSSYDGDSYNFPRYELPFGWSCSEDGQSTFGFRNEEFYDSYSQEFRRGTQPMQQRASMSRGDAVNGKEAWLNVAPIYVGQADVTARFEYSITQSPNRFSTEAYTEWAEGDLLEIRVSEDNGTTWKTLTTYTDAEHPAQEDALAYVNIDADLNDYYGKTVLVQFYWKTFATPGFGANLYINRFSVAKPEVPLVPEVSVSKVTYSSAVVSWLSRQSDFEFVYNKKGGETSTTVEVNGAKSYTLENLEANTVYEVKVRGLLYGEEKTYSEWSKVVEFTTLDYPEAEVPQNLESNTDNYTTVGYIELAWDAVADAVSYEVAYRLSSSTEWSSVESESNFAVLLNLEEGKEYVWKVRAFCTHDRVSAYSAQMRFTVPLNTGVNGVGADNVAVFVSDGCVKVNGAAGLPVAVYNVAGSLVGDTPCASAAESYGLPAGLYIVVAGNDSYKVVVR